MNKINILILNFAIGYYDPDYGDSFAGNGSRIIGAFKDKEDAKKIAEEFNPILEKAEKETTVFPVQENNQKIKNQFGFTLHNIDGGYDFKLTIEEYNIQ